ncbi:MAG: PEP-CTERM system TPR-repeat protein PrsT [Burkholderiales bacterium]|nr:PEP-CTERM system TPR-repeat protein PrsT [Burkholderiales bacterium]
MPLLPRPAPRRFHPGRSALGLAAALAVLLGACGRTSPQAEVAQARTLFERHDYAAAMIQAKNALQQQPRNGEARLLLGRSLLQTGDPAAAEVELRKALEAGAAESAATPPLAQAMLAQGQARRLILEFAATTLPEAQASADLRTTLAAAYAQVGERDNAMSTLQAALKEWPQHVPAALLQARLLAGGGDLAGANAGVDAVLAREPQSVPALMLKAELQRYGGQADAALASYRQAATADPKGVAPLAAVTSMLIDRHDLAGARAALAPLEAAHPQHPEVLLLQARLAYVDGRLDRARELTEQLLKRAPNDPRLLQLAGATALRQNALVQARSWLEQALKAAPGARQPRQLLAQIALHDGQPQRALDLLQPLIDGAAPDAASLTLAGQAYLQSGDLAHSQAAFTRATQADPKLAAARTGLALNQLAQGHTSEGFAELQSAAEQDRGSRADLALIAARLQTGDLDGALAAVAALDKKQPGTALAAALRGDIQARRKDPADAAASYAQALKIDPRYYPAVAGLAALDLAAGHADAARQRFEALVQADPQNYRALLALAELKAKSGAPPAEVAQALTAAVRASPGTLAPRLMLIDYLLARREAQAALAAAQDAHAALPDRPELLDRLGLAQQAAGDTQQALASFGKLVQQQPDRPEPQLRIADVDFAAKDLDGARKSLQRALEVSPGLPAAEAGLARVALLQQRPAQALDIARQMQKAQPRQAAGFLLEAQVQGALKRPDLAAAALRQALALQPDSPLAVRLHQALVAAGQAAQADRLAGQWQADHPKDAAFRYYLGDVALARKDYAGAEQRYRSVLDIQPDNALALNNVAWLMTHQGQAGAVVLAERANRLLPGQAALLDTLAGALAAEQQWPRAIETEKDAVQRAPDDPNLRFTLAKLYLKAGDRRQARVELERLAQLGDRFAGQRDVAELMKSL